MQRGAIRDLCRSIPDFIAFHPGYVRCGGLMPDRIHAIFLLWYPSIATSVASVHAPDVCSN